MRERQSHRSQQLQRRNGENLIRDPTSELPWRNFTARKVLLLDFDAQANLTTGMGFDPDEYDSMAPVLQGKKELSAVILPTKYNNLS